MAISVSNHLKPLELAKLKMLAKYKLETFRRVLQFFDHQLDADGNPALDDAMKMLSEDSYKTATEAMRVSERNEAIGDLEDASENMKSAYQVLDYAIHIVRNYCTGVYGRREIPQKYQAYARRY